LAHTLRDASLVVWVAAIAWLAPRLVAEFRWPRLRYDMRRGATVFPLGMYAACSFSVAFAADVPGIGGFARVWAWIAFACWSLVLAATLRSAGRSVRRALAKREAPGCGGAR
jgi:hypothetical protein